ncbi:MAG: hypothetical protein JST21_01930 [Bacteroidetes bacterium]|nr:hypothetical protein [Bacteroidota bacterium]
MKETINNRFLVPQSFLHLHPRFTGNQCGYIDLTQKIIDNLEPCVIQNIAMSLGLSFVNQKEKESEVCFLNSEDVRPEFRLSFAPIDLADYIYAILIDPAIKKQPEKSNDAMYLEIPYPNDDVTFWTLVKAGEKLRQAL